jgi:hypothetical protein
MELAKEKLGFDVRVVTLPKGQDPADAPAGFEAKLAQAEGYIVYRIRLVLDRTPDRHEAFARGLEILQRNEDSPDWQDALRLFADRLDVPKESLASITPKGGVRTLTEELSPRMLEKGERLERNALAACVAHPGLVKLLAELGPEHFDSELHRRFRAHLVDGGELETDLVALRAELDARGAREGLDERTGKELLLNLRERRLRRELAHAEFEQMKELQNQLERVKDAILELA